jgi:hypothetical protein
MFASKKLLALLFLIVILSSFLVFSVKETRAAAIVGDPWNFLKEFVIRPLIRMIANQLESKLLNKINGQMANMDGKNPTFITNWRNHLLDSQARGNDVFRSVLADAKLCPYLDQNMKLAFGADKYIGALAGSIVKNLSGQVVYQNKVTVPGMPSFQQSANCTLSAGINVGDFQKNFNKGGWAAWDQLIKPQNNFYGSYSLAIAEQARQISVESQTTMNAAVAGNGFLSQKLGVGNAGVGPTGCTNITSTSGLPPAVAAVMTPISRCAFLGKIVTPEQILGKSAVNSIDAKLKRPGAASEITDIVLNLFAAVLNGTLNRLVNYIGQNTYDRPPSQDGYSEGQFQAGTNDSQVNGAMNQVNQTTQQLSGSCESSCNNSCTSSSSCAMGDTTCQETFNSCIADCSARCQPPSTAP